MEKVDNEIFAGLEFERGYGVGREEGVKEGREEGRREGKEEGMREGRKEGFKEAQRMFLGGFEDEVGGGEAWQGMVTLGGWRRRGMMRRKRGTWVRGWSHRHRSSSCGGACVDAGRGLR